MDTMEAETVTLYELLGRHWTVGAPITSTAFDAAGQVVAFALADGALAIAPLADIEPPQDRCRIALDGGRATISPRRKPVPPLTKVAISDARFHLAPIGTSSFIASDCSRLLSVSASGVTQPAANHGSPIDLIAPVQAGGILVASGGSVISYDSIREPWCARLQSLLFAFFQPGAVSAGCWIFCGRSLLPFQGIACPRL